MMDVHGNQSSRMIVFVISFRDLVALLLGNIVKFDQIKLFQDMERTAPGLVYCTLKFWELSVWLYWVSG